VIIELAAPGDRGAVWDILEPAIRAGETLALPRNMSRDEAFAYWFDPEYEVFVARDADGIVGTYCLRANRQGGGAHVANCGYVAAPSASGRGVGRAMCEHSIERAKARGFRAMQFNFVVSSNERAVHLWQSCGFTVVGRLPAAFNHPTLGYVDALVMYRPL
jgi:ribosomal protein S18 acetylase RimI-like enzyme